MKAKLRQTKKKFQPRLLFVSVFLLVLIIIFFVLYFLNKTDGLDSFLTKGSFEITAEPTAYLTVKSLPTNPPAIELSPVSTPVLLTGKPLDWQSLTIPESELVTAINNYRQSHGLTNLKVNEGLCREARKRAQDLVDQNVGRLPPFLLSHEQFLQDIKDGTLGKLSGLTFFGENVASSNCKRITDNVDVFVANATQLVEWCFDASESHREAMLRSDWTNVCSSGHYPFYVQIFGK